MSSKRIGPFLGLNNTRPLTQLEQFERGQRSGDFMRSADNVDVTDAGTLRRRQGWAKRLGGTQMRGLFALDDGSALVADYNQLCRLTYEDGQLTKQALMAELRPGAGVSYTATPAGVYLTDGYGLWVLRGGAVARATMDAPTAPGLSASAGGSLPGGLYQVACTFERHDGTQSCASVSVQADVPDGGILNIHLPATTQPLTAWVNVFVSPVNGDALFLAERLPIGTTSTTLYVPPEQGGRCMTLYMAPMPAGQIVRQHLGKLLVARGAAVFTSQPYAYGIYDPAEDFMQFPAEVTLLEPVGAGLFIVADKTYFLPNEPGAAIVEVLPYGAPRGAAVQRGEGGGIYWMGDRGLVQATDDGQAKNVNDGVLALPKPHSAALLVREQDGMEQIVAATQARHGVSVAASRSFMDAQIIKQGVTNA